MCVCVGVNKCLYICGKVLGAGLDRFKLIVI